MVLVQLMVNEVIFVLAKIVLASKYPNKEAGKVVQQRLGHENSKVTLDSYAHITNNAPKKTGQDFADTMAHQ
ncbi:integrase [Enterococcus ureilyticus]|nr:integrase [Enterococcus ureilyticus]